MIKNQLLRLVVGLLVAGSASAEETRLTIALDWRHVPRGTVDGLTPAAKQEAVIPQGVVTYWRFDTGARFFSVLYDSSFECKTGARRGERVFLTCGSASGRYVLTQNSGSPALLEWVTDAAANITPRTEVGM